MVCITIKLSFGLILAAATFFIGSHISNESENANEIAVSGETRFGKTCVQKCLELMTLCEKLCSYYYIVNLK
ncbi:hypothetical protein T03_14307 [Trichinella britovi]|uniref:Uncharacterized protein n=1 Tax=Trichinella britovi TaxID=45882 RepID=A0A0V1DHG9_TRIBR|nr:hypothetical protein T03_14307 [Trichinella britovi]